MNELCKKCERPIPYSRLHYHPNAKYCSARCGDRVALEQKKANMSHSAFSLSTIGAISELKAIVDLMEKGYEVFRASSPACSCDLAILKDGILLRVEVTTGTIYKATGRLFWAEHDAKKYDVIAIVLPNSVVYQPELILAPESNRRALRAKRK